MADPVPPGDAFALDGRVTVVTGAASGIGRGTALVLAQAGTRVMLADIDEKGLAETKALVCSAGGTAAVQPTDVARITDIDRLAEAALGAFGRLDCWVNSAGITCWSGLLDAAPEDVDRLMSVNLLGTYWGTVAAGRAMRG